MTRDSTATAPQGQAAAAREAGLSPRVGNTGANKPTLWKTDDLKWDWYEATVHDLRPQDVQRVVFAMLSVLGRDDWVMTSGRWGYVSGWKRGSETGGTITVYEGADEVHIVGTGPMSPGVAGFMRRMYPGHSVSRADVALDVDMPGVFEVLWRRVHVRAVGMKPRPVSTELAGDWANDIGSRPSSVWDGVESRGKGRTFYAGGRTSRMRVRVYEKGLQQLGLDPTCGASPDWARVEWQLRPDSSQKVWLGAAEIHEAVALTRFGAIVAEDMMRGEFGAFAPSELRHASTHPAMWMVRHYKKVLGPLLELEPDALHRELAALVERHASEFGSGELVPDAWLAPAMEAAPAF